MAEEQAPKKKVPFVQQVSTMGWNFWICNVIEAFERLAFFSVSAIRSLYMKKALGIGGARGTILGTWALIQCLVPMVSGGYADAYGYRKSMYVAFLINICGYALMANTSGFGDMFVAACLVGLGTAIFKPPVQGSIAKSLNEDNSGVGFGIFYWLVNVGGFFAPMAGAALRGNEQNPTWHYVFYGAALVTAFNFLPSTFLFREPKLDTAAQAKSPVQVFVDSFGQLLKDRNMLFFLLIISGFWFMFMQLWDLLPIAIDEWVDTRDVGGLIAGWGPWWQKSFLNADGGAKAELLINIDAFAIILLVIPVSAFFSRFPMMVALLLGMAIGTAGFVGSGVYGSGYMVSLMIFVFAVGEMICSPKFTEYIGMTAPPDKKALYLGYSNIPFAVGWAGGNFLSHPMYDALSSRQRFAARYLLEELKTPKPEVDRLIAAGKTLKASPDMPLLMAINDKLKAQGQGYTGTDQGGAAWHVIPLLRKAYKPWSIWLILGAVGLASLIGMWLFNARTKAKRARDEAAQ